MRVALLSFLLASTVAVFAQTPAPTTLPSVNLQQTIENLVAGACPVGMTAQRQASGQREWIVSLEDAMQAPHGETRANQAGVRVELIGIKGKGMTQAEVAVYYMAPGLHALPVGEANSTPVVATDLNKTFILSTTNLESATRLMGNLLVGPAASVTRVRLLSVTYADGSVWRPIKRSDCTVAPSLFMTLATR